MLSSDCNQLHDEATEGHAFDGLPPFNSDKRDKRNYIRVLLYSHYTTIAGWGVLLSYSRAGV